MTSRWCVQSPTTSGDVARDQVCREGQTQSGQAGRSGRRKGRQRESYPITESDLERLDDGEAITVRPDGWLRGQLAQLDAVRDDFERALEDEEEEVCNSHND